MHLITGEDTGGVKLVVDHSSFAFKVSSFRVILIYLTPPKHIYSTFLVHIDGLSLCIVTYAVYKRQFAHCNFIFWVQKLEFVLDR